MLLMDDYVVFFFLFFNPFSRCCVLVMKLSNLIVLHRRSIHSCLRYSPEVFVIFKYLGYDHCFYSYLKFKYSVQGHPYAYVF